MARRGALLVAENGSKLPSIVGSVIYVRLSTKEQTDNLSLPTQLCRYVPRPPMVEDKITTVIMTSRARMLFTQKHSRSKTPV